MHITEVTRIFLQITGMLLVAFTLIIGLDLDCTKLPRNNQKK